MDENQIDEALAPVTREEVEALITSVAGQLEARIEAAARAGSPLDAAREEALEMRERTLEQRETAAKTAETLRARGLPEALAEALSFPDESAMTRAVDELEAAFRKAVQSGVEERLKGDAPKSAPVKPLSELPDNEYYAAISRR